DYASFRHSPDRRPLPQRRTHRRRIVRRPRRLAARPVRLQQGQAAEHPPPHPRPRHGLGENLEVEELLLKQWTRRQLIQRGAALSAGLITARARGTMAHPSKAKTLDAMKLASFVDPLPLPVLQTPQGRRSSAALGAANAPYYPVHIREIRSKLHRDLPPSRLFGYGPTSAPVLFEAQSNEGVLIDWINDLPPQHFLPLTAPHPGMEH